MRRLLVSCAAGVAASQGLADATTTDQMVCD
jgi:hypothetical protein